MLSRLGMLIFGLGTCFLCWGAGSEQTPVWKTGERLHYEIGYGFITAGDALLFTGQEDEKQLKFLVLAHNNGFFQSIYPVSDTIRTLVDDETLKPFFFRKINHEGGWHNRSQIHFDWAQQHARLTDSVFTSEGAVKRFTDTTVTLDGEFHTIISAFYKVRTMSLEPGKTGFFQAVSGKKKYRMKVICHRRETIEVLAGRFACLVVEPVMDEDGLFKAKGKLTIWLSDDERRLPVLMKSKIAVGSIRAELKNWSQGPECTIGAWPPRDAD